MTKIFFDTEFTGLHQSTSLISIGLIAESGETFYAELIDYDESQINDWLKENVLDNLCLGHLSQNRIMLFGDGQEKAITLRGTKHVVASHLTHWLEGFDKSVMANQIQMWSDCLAYDWVLFNSLMADYSEGYPQLPAGIHYIPMDICTLFHANGIDPDVIREKFAFPDEYAGAKDYGQRKHNALWDAKVIKRCYEKLTS